MKFPHADQRLLEHAQGYLELGMPVDAEAELEKMGVELRNDPRVLDLRLDILMQRAHWEPAVQLCRKLVHLQPDDPGWVIKLAYATRRAESIEAARRILLEMEKKFPEEATIQFNLGCYAARLGQLKEATTYVKRAIELDPSFKQMAKEDEDLESIREEFAAHE